jgi:sugar lactone lactonase YvrE
VRRLLVAAIAAGLLGLTPAADATDRPAGDTRVFARVTKPGFPAYAFVHRNGRVYAGTYTNPARDSQRSRIFEWTADGTLEHAWTVPGQDLSVDHGVQVANQDASGRLILLEKSTSRVLTLNVKTGRFRTWARFPDLHDTPNLADEKAIPNYATWGPGGSLFVSDYGQAVIWRIPPGGGTPRQWFQSSALDGTDFGTTGLAYRPATHDLMIGQGSTAADGSVPVNGKLYRLPITASGRPGRLTTLWTSGPAELPDGFGIARSGHIYVALAGLSNQLVELSATGVELGRIGTQLTGDNGSAIPFDTPSSATFLGTRVLVANQSFTGDSTHHAILDVEVGEPGRAPYLPKSAVWR